MAANPFTWVEIYVQDLDRAKTFYEAVFDFKLEKLQTEIPIWAFQTIDRPVWLHWPADRHRREPDRGAFDGLKHP
jgi:catechol 2,3-dioxygenase-like lactoylglutathione lyase family enzyme